MMLNDEIIFKKNFLKNLGVSLLAFFIISILGLCVFMVTRLVTFIPSVEESRSEILSFGIELILWGQSLFALVFCFHLGRKRHLMRNNILNFLSVSSGCAFGLMTLLWGWWNPYAVILLQFSLVRIMMLIMDDLTRIFYILIPLYLLLPTLSMWIGMLYQKKEKLNDKA